MPYPHRMPSLFIAHGSPLNAILDTQFSRAWKALGPALPRPAAILAISAHWETAGTAVTAMNHPRTIHDFWGFPPALYEIQYPVPGSPLLAERVRELLSPQPVALDEEVWGLDHGSWSVLVHMYPQADIPVVQLSLDATLYPEQHYQLAQRLQPLRDEGVLIIGFGNIVHNLRAAQRTDAMPPYPWAVEFEQAVRAALERGDHRALCQWESLTPAARLSAPTPEHYLPLLYAAGASGGDPAWFPIEGIVWGSISMLSVGFGDRPST